MSKPSSVLIIGAGPAGLTAAHELLRHNVHPIVLEKSNYVGGIARTEVYNSYRFDIGGHRFYTKADEVNQLWHDILGSDLRLTPRLSRIYYHQRYFPYPLKLFETLTKLGVTESVKILVSYLTARLMPSREEKTFEQWVSNRFGHYLYTTFFKSYTEKVWGIPCNEIQAEWAAQRIKGLSLKSALTGTLFGDNRKLETLIEQFDYPVLGPGMMWETLQDYIEQRGGQVQMETEAVHLVREENRITHVVTMAGHEKNSCPVEQVISTMPLNLLLEQLSPSPPHEVLQAARGLKYRAFLLVGLIVDCAEIFPDNWIYIHEPSVKVGRIQNFKNWSADMVPDIHKTSLGMEYFCDATTHDEIWNQTDEALIALATQELAQLGLTTTRSVLDGTVIRQPKAYPVYDSHYSQNLAIIREYLGSIENLQTIGRNGMHRYNNQDHSMLTGILAARNLLGGRYDLWNVNTDSAYYEEYPQSHHQYKV